MLYQLPTDPAIVSADPLGILDKQDVSQAEVLSALFEPALSALASGASPTALIPTLIEDIAYTVHGDGALDTRGLRNFLQKASIPPASFLDLLRAAKALSKQFPTHHLTTLSQSENKISLTGASVDSLLAHQFLGTLAQPKVTDWGRPDFTSWFASEPAHHKAVHGYLETILNHFEKSGYSEADVFQFAFYNAANMPNPSEITAVPNLQFTTISEEFEPSENKDSPFVLVAANAQPGPGPTATQEERLQSASPALSLSALLIPIIPDDAVVVTSAFPVHAAWKGHNRSARLETLYPPVQRPKRHYILADALPLDTMDDEECMLKDLVADRAEREVKKLYAAFRGASEMVSLEGGREDTVVEAGLWGCGAYGGNALVKRRCIEVAAGLADVTLVLSVLEGRQADVWGNDASAAFGRTTAEVWEQLLKSKTIDDLV